MRRGILLIFWTFSLFSQSLEEAQELLHQGLLSQAYTVFKDVASTAADPNRQALALLYAGYVKYLQQDFAKARNLIVEAFYMDPQVAYEDAGFERAFVSYLQQVRMEEQLNILGVLDLAELKMRLGNLEEAQKLLNKLMEKGYLYQELYRLLAKLAIQKGEIEKAENYTHQALTSKSFRLEKFKKTPAYHLYLALNAFQQGEYEKALQALSEGGEDEGLFKFRLALYLKMGQVGDALTLLNNHPQALQENRDLAMLQCILLYQVKQKETALNHLLRLAEKDKFWSDPLIYLARLYWEMGDFSRAEGYYQKAIILDPTRGDWRYELGNLLVQQNRWEEAQEHFLLAYKWEPSNRDYQRAYALILLNQGQYKEAREFLSQRRNDQPDDPWIKIALGISSLNLKDWKSCLNLLHQPTSPQEYHLAGRCAYEGKNYPLASQYFDKAQAFHDLAASLLMEGKVKEAWEIAQKLPENDPLRKQAEAYWHIYSQLVGSS